MRAGPLLFAGVVAATFATSAHASPEDIFGYGPRSPAMGGTGTAYSDSFDAAYTNPALLSRIHEKKLTLGFQSATFDLNASGAGEPGRVSVLPMKGYVIGADLPLPFGGVLKDRVAMGFAFYTPTDVIVRGDIRYPETPQFPLLADRAQSLMVRGGIGMDIGWGVRLGIGVSALAEIDGSVIVATDATGKVGSSVQDQLIAVYAPELGVSWDLPVGEAHTWRVGATYRGALDARFAVEIDATKLSTLALPVFNIAGVAQYDPAEVVFEAAHETHDWTLAAGFTFKRWSQYPGAIEPTILCPAAQPGCGALTPAQISFSDTLVPRLGAERRFRIAPAATVAARGGFFYEPTPVPTSLPASQAFDESMQATTNVPTRFFDASKYVFSLGGGIAMARPLPPLTIDAWAQLQLLAPHDVQVPPAGSASLSGHVLATGLLAGVKF